MLVIARNKRIIARVDEYNYKEWSREFHDVLTEFSDIEDIAGPELSKKYDLLDPKSFKIPKTYQIIQNYIK